MVERIEDKVPLLSLGIKWGKISVLEVSHNDCILSWLYVLFWERLLISHSSVFSSVKWTNERDMDQIHETFGYSILRKSD